MPADTSELSLRRRKIAAYRRRCLIAADRRRGTHQAAARRTISLPATNLERVPPGRYWFVRLPVCSSARHADRQRQG